MVKSKNNQSAKTKAHSFGVILERVESKLDLIVEGHQVLDQKIDELRINVDERFTIVDQKFDAVFDELHLIRNDLKEKVSRDEFVVLEKRVMALEKKINHSG